MRTLGQAGCNTFSPKLLEFSSDRKIHKSSREGKIFQASGVSQECRSFYPDPASRAGEDALPHCCAQRNLLLPPQKNPKTTEQTARDLLSSLQVLARAEHTASAAFSSTDNAGWLPDGEGGEEHRTAPGHLKKNLFSK